MSDSTDVPVTSDERTDALWALAYEYVSKRHDVPDRVKQVAWWKFSKTLQKQDWTIQDLLMLYLEQTVEAERLKDLKDSLVTGIPSC